MKVILRADAGRQRGTGHVMRCLTVAEALRAAGHDVALMGAIDDVDWLERHLYDTGIPCIPTEQDALPLAQLVELGADRLVVDSYWIDPDDIAAVDTQVPTMAIVDNDTRGIRATWYVDHNLGAEGRDWSAASGQVLAGSRYALVRDAILRHRINSGWDIPGRDSHVVAIMGGTDPACAMTSVAASIAATLPHLRFTAITTSAQVSEVEAAVAAMPNATVLGPRLDLPDLLGTADAVVSAAGTSAWDVCTMGRPVVLVGVVDNQSSGLRQAIERGIAAGIDWTKDGGASVGTLVAEMLDDVDRRRSFVTRANETFDGRGSRRVAAALAAEPPPPRRRFSD
jgi:spore coat polysaccharide biosynthesis predicted glycosyltransferase SpsG